MSILKILLWVGAVVALLLVGFVIWALQAPDRPRLQGGEQVSTRLLTLPQAKDGFSERGGRALSLRVWAPTDATSGPRAPSMDGRVSAAFAKLNGFPGDDSDGPPSESFDGTEEKLLGISW